MYAYEVQVPEIAKQKIETLKKHYGIISEKSLSFFSVHLSADQWHSEECGQLIDKLPENERKESFLSAQKN